MTVFRVRLPGWAFSNSPTARKRKEGIVHAVIEVTATWPVRYGRMSEITGTTACGRELDMVYDSHYQTPRKCGICETAVHRLRDSEDVWDALAPVQVVPELPLIERLRIEQLTWPNSTKKAIKERDAKIRVALNEAQQERLSL